jgi:hypothetical protein
VDPPEKPRICVCTAAETPTVQRSLLMEVIEGDIADGGGDLTVVSLVEFEVTVLLEVESVTIGCAIARDVVITKSTAAVIFLNVIFYLLFYFCCLIFVFVIE